MLFMNRYDIEEAEARFRHDPVLGPAARYLRAFQEEVDAHSDGWPYWHAAPRAAARLMTLLDRHMMCGNLPSPTFADVQASIRPIKAFMTRRGQAAGMRLPSFQAR